MIYGGAGSDSGTGPVCFRGAPLAAWLSAGTVNFTATALLAMLGVIAVNPSWSFSREMLKRMSILTDCRSATNFTATAEDAKDAEVRGGLLYPTATPRRGPLQFPKHPLAT